MVENSRRDRVGLGLIGLGPSWEQQYRETLSRLDSRLRIRVVYDPVEARARTVAGELDAEVAGSLRQILSRHSLQGLLVLDPGWCAPGILSLVAKSGKPAYLAYPLLKHEFALREVLNGVLNGGCSSNQSYKADDQLMPELGLRYTPASCRLRELMATKLGAARTIVIESDLSDEHHEVASLVDWCAHIMGQPPTLPAQFNFSESGLEQIEFNFPARQKSPELPTSAIRHASLRHDMSGDGTVRIEVECERGRATLLDRARIVWEGSSESADESLGDERTEIEILIDQFCRRALGGLNPVGRLSEFVRAFELVKSIRGEVA